MRTTSRRWYRFTWAAGGLGQRIMRATRRTMRTTRRCRRWRRWATGIVRTARRSMGRRRRGSWRAGRSGRAFRRARRRPDRRVKRLRGQRDGLAADRRLDLGQLAGHAFEVFCEAASLPGDIGQRAARTNDTGKPVRDPPGCTLRLRCGLRTACGGPGSIDSGGGFATSRYQQRPDVEDVLPQA
ncbi:hypothetical protein A5641_28415 [Mycobacterium sp. 1554424.7]|nr:hypothetical protein A5641_28415 [Mycobacterium sp. 1554424.7]